MAGPAVGGEASVRYALHLLRPEINVDLALAGGARVENAGRERVVRSANGVMSAGRVARFRR
jgi:isopentenyl diphosphate isomerase/L-lactate dehydrogenase-like FMN-dependent dehydrogenase